MFPPVCPTPTRWPTLLSKTLTPPSSDGRFFPPSSCSLYFSQDLPPIKPASPFLNIANFSSFLLLFVRGLFRFPSMAGLLFRTHARSSNLFLPRELALLPLPAGSFTVRLIFGRRNVFETSFVLFPPQLACPGWSAASRALFSC